MSPDTDGDPGVASRRASLRRGVGVLVLVLWGATLAWNARRIYHEPETERLARAARTIPPGPAYYALYRGDRRAGWAQSDIDTLPSGGGFLLENRLDIDLSSLGLPGTSRIRTHAELGPSLSLRSFTFEVEGMPASMSATGTVEGDTLLRVVVRRGETEDSTTLALEEPLILADALPLRLAAEGEVRPGDRFRVRTFDPMQMSTRSVEIEILDRQIRSYPDSVVRDRTTDRWVVARRDTVEAWKVSREMAGVQLESWIDEDGRVLEASTGAGFRLERTAFELAYLTGEGRR